MENKKILVTGATGMVGKLVASMLSPANEVFSPGRSEMDITDSALTIKTITSFNPVLVIHCAALTDVDGCQSEPKRAYAVNAAGTQNVATGCAENGSTMIYLSTDFVFDGKKKIPYSETDTPAPLSIYGETKLLGEYYVSHMLSKFLIVRVSRIFGSGGKNFASRLPALIHNKFPLLLTTDSVNSPTSVKDLAAALIFLAEKKFYGLVNVCNKGECSWHGYAQEVAQILKAKQPELSPVASSDFKQKAPRPLYSTLKTELLASLGFSMPAWQDSLRRWLLSEASTPGRK